MVNVDRHIAVQAGWLAGPAFGVAMMAAPEYFHLGPFGSAIAFWGGIAVFFLTILTVAIISAHEEKKRNAVIAPIALMAIGLLIFGCGAAWYFWPQRQSDTSEVAGDLLLECREATLPSVGIPGYSELNMISPFRFGDQGSIGVSSMPTEPGQPIKWPDDWKDKRSGHARCKLTSYGKSVLFKVEIKYRVTFVRIVRGDTPNSAKTGDVINVADSSISITKLEPGAENGFVFYVQNQGRDFVHVTFEQTAYALPYGEQSKKNFNLIQSTGMMGNAVGLWPIRDAQEIIRLEEEEASKKQP